MIKQIEVTLLVEVDTQDQEICPSGNPLLENVVLNTVDDGFFMSPVKVLSVKDSQADSFSTNLILNIN